MKDKWHAFLPYPEASVERCEHGPLAGFRLAVKDLFDVAGYPTGAGNALVLAASGIKAETAPTISRLLANGARFVGKTVTDELAYSLIGQNIHFGMPINPKWPDRIPGGSSSGSAVAVAAGLADIGVGTDTSGSTRLPAAVNGIWGWRPTHGLLPISGCRPLAPSFDTVGFLAASLDIIERVMTALAISDNKLDEAEFLVPEDILERCDKEIVTAFLEFIANSNRPCRLIKSATVIGLDECRDIFNTILWKEAWSTNQGVVSKAASSIDPAILARLKLGESIEQSQTDHALVTKSIFSDELASLLSDGSMLVFPTLPYAAPRRNADKTQWDSFRSDAITFLCGAGLSGCPQLAGPFGPAPGMSISIVGGHNQDRGLLRAAVAMGLGTDFPSVC